MSEQKLKVFLCHSSSDKPAVRDLYNRLRSAADFISPWLDEEDLLPGQKWQDEIPKAVRNSDVVIVCLSRGSINKTGYVQKEIKYALDVADEQPEGTIFLIPVGLEDCELPERLKHLHCVNIREEKGFDRLMRALIARAGKLGVRSESVRKPNVDYLSRALRAPSIYSIVEELEQRIAELRRIIVDRAGAPPPSAIEEVNHLFGEVNGLWKFSGSDTATQMALRDVSSALSALREACENRRDPGVGAGKSEGDPSAGSGDVREGGFLTIDATHFLQGEGETWDEPVRETQSVKSLLDSLWSKLRTHLPAHTYAKSWVLRNKETGEVYWGLTASLEAYHGLGSKALTLKEVGIAPGMALEVVPLSGSESEAS